MRGRIDHRFVDSTVCLSERPLIRLAALDTFSPKGAKALEERKAFPPRGEGGIRRLTEAG